jgi:dipeptidyl aminopeptidase/acylaminoacyl peptidase
MAGWTIANSSRAEVSVFHIHFSSSVMPESTQNRAAHRVRPLAPIMAAAIALGVAACADATSPTASPNDFPSAAALGKGGNGGGTGGNAAAPRIAFVRNDPGYDHGSIFVKSSDASEGEPGVQVTFGNKDRLPSWSPDYRKIAFQRLGSDQYEYIYVVSASGSGQPKKLVQGYTPRWSPDGTKIAFTAYAADGDVSNGDVYVMSANGGNITRLTTATNTDFFPSWSPDGSKIAFASKRTGTHEIFVMNADGTAQTQVTNCAIEGAQCSAPSWSPIPGDNRLAFYYAGSLLGSNFTAIRTISANGTGLTTVLLTPELGKVDWSPDGTRIAFSSNHGGRTRPEIFTILLDGTGLEQVTSRAQAEFDVAWIP